METSEDIRRVFAKLRTYSVKAKSSLMMMENPMMITKELYES